MAFYTLFMMYLTPPPTRTTTTPITTRNFSTGGGHLAHHVCATPTPVSITHPLASYLQVLPIFLYLSIPNANTYLSNSNLNLSTLYASTTFL